MTQIKGVLFDMDGTLLDTETPCQQAFVAAAADQGIDGVDHVFMACVGLGGGQADAIVAAHLGDRLDLARFDRDWTEHMDRLLAEEIALKPGVADLLDALSALGLPMVVATSTQTSRAKHHLQDAGILGYFVDVIGGDQVERTKPDPAIYHLAAGVLSLEPSACVAFEDSDPGTRAALAAGAQTVQIPDLKQPSAELVAMGHVIAPDLLTGARLIGLLPDAKAQSA